jgi:DNA-binding protein H-NS
MQDLSNYSLLQLRKLEAQVTEELKNRHFLGISQAREQILHIAQSAGISVKDLLSGKGAKVTKGEPAAVKFRHPDDATKQWSGRGRKPGWLKEWTASGKSLDETKV